MKPKKNRIFCRDCNKYKTLFESESKADNFIKFNHEEIEACSGHAPSRSYYCRSCVGYDIVRNDKIDFSGLGDYGGILLSPGPGIPAEAGELLKLIEFCKYTHPILGICLGHQAIAETFGASLYNLSRPLHGHRSVLKKVDEHDPLFEDLADPIQVGRYHSWVIDPETMPGELITSSIDEQGHIMSFYHTELPIHGIQFHPESYISDCGSGIIRNWLKMVR